MKNAYTFSILVILSLCLPPFQTAQAALVPVEKTSSPTKKFKKKAPRQNIKKTKFQLRKQKEAHQKHSYKPEQQNDYEGIWITIITLISIYLITDILFIIFGFVFGLVGLWITGICLLVIPILIFLIRSIDGNIKRRKLEKKNNIE